MSCYQHQVLVLYLYLEAEAKAHCLDQITVSQKGALQAPPHRLYNEWVTLSVSLHLALFILITSSVPSCFLNRTLEHTWYSGSSGTRAPPCFGQSPLKEDFLHQNVHSIKEDKDLAYWWMIPPVQYPVYGTFSHVCGFRISDDPLMNLRWAISWDVLILMPTFPVLKHLNR